MDKYKVIDKVMADLKVYCVVLEILRYGMFNICIEILHSEMFQIH
jgi:hypothetical protein